MIVEPGLTDFSRVYGNGEFTWSGFWTVSAPPGEIHDDLVAAWKMVPGPVSRWHMPITFITAEGFVSDLDDRGATMLRYWSSERTLWLRDLFGEPEPLHAPLLTGRVSGAFGIDVIRGNDDRGASDRYEIAVRLNRSSESSTAPD